ncbi:hypothetical protein EV702DRAFT_1193618 [Suillus placidus]|uniref:Uncharacterized protein n=1 Tax=Suillus placidus TaxID=48579 RepID=A0A9P7D6W4_9AGAM|nr:hypothetical protein EV702DRAFT_1193618 [Suillus placidus]
MPSFSTLALILPAVLAAPLKLFATHHQYSPSCVIAGLTYPDPRHTLILLGKRELSPPTGVSERAFTDFLLLCHESDSRPPSSPLVARQEGSFLSNAFGDPAGNESMLDTTTPEGAPQGSGDQRASSPTATASPSTTPPTSTSPASSPSETPASAAGPASTGTPAGPAGNPPSGNAAAIAPADNDASHDTNASETQSDSSAFDTPFTATPQGVAAGQSSSFVHSNVSGSFGGAFSSLDDLPADDAGDLVAVDAQSGV